MVAIRNRTNRVPHVFRYPKWEPDVFYPAGSLVCYPVQDLQLYDSDVVFYEFFVSKFDIQPGTQAPTENSVDWKFIMSTAKSLDSELELRLRALDSDITVAEEKIVRLINFDSDIARKVDSEITLRLEGDSELWAFIDSEIRRKIDSYLQDSEIRVERVLFTEDSDIGALRWNSDEKTLDLQLNADVTLQIGQEQVFYGKATEAISNGDAVMFAGAQGDHLLFRKADQTVANFKDAWVIGVATQSLATNDFGFVTVEGKVRDLNTSAWPEGTLLYLSPDQAGVLIDSEPLAPSHGILIAAVTRQHGVYGSLYVRPVFGDHINSLHDVLAPTPKGGDVLAWDSDLAVWKAVSIGDAQSLAGGTPYDYGTF